MDQTEVHLGLERSDTHLAFAYASHVAHACRRRITRAVRKVLAPVEPESTVTMRF